MDEASLASEFGKRRSPGLTWKARGQETRMIRISIEEHAAFLAQRKAELGLTGRDYLPRNSGDRRATWRACRQGRMQTDRSEEHKSELQSLIRTPYAVFCMTKQN